MATLSVYACVVSDYVLIMFLILSHRVSTVPAIPEEPQFETVGRRPNSIYEVTYERTPTLGCDKLFPKWVSGKVSIILMDEPDNVAVVDFVSGKPATWKWPVLGVCWKPDKIDFDRGHFIYECIDSFWGRQPDYVYQPLPEGEVLRTGKFRNYCPAGTRLAYRPISLPLHIQILWPQHECACLDINVITKIVKSMSSQCVEAPANPKFGASIASVWASVGKQVTFPLKFTKVTRAGSQQRSFEPLDLNPAFAAIRDRDSSDVLYRACFVNDLVTDISLHIDVVESSLVE